MHIIEIMISFILHIDTHLGEIITNFGHWSYIVLFSIIFSETGFVFTPFLPGDSLIFAAGTFAALGSLNLALLLLILCIAAFLGDTANYWIGHFFGKKIINSPKIPFINQEHIDKTQLFYKKHGGKTIFLARFIPIIRTFAPFVAGVGKMDYFKFIYFNIAGSLTWVFSFTLLGYFFGNIPLVRDHLSLVFLAIILISVIPIFLELLKKKH